MFITAISFALMAIVFALMSFFINVWLYYIPVTLIALCVWLKIIQPVWNENVDSFMTSMVKEDPKAAGAYIFFISVAYGIVSIFLGNWIPLVLCVGVFFFAFIVVKSYMSDVS